MISMAGSGRAVVRGVGERRAWERYLAARIRGRRRKNGRQRIVSVREGNLGWEAKGEVVRDQVDEMSEIDRRGGDLRRGSILLLYQHGSHETLELYILFKSLRSAIGTPPMKYTSLPSPPLFRFRCCRP